MVAYDIMMLTPLMHWVLRLTLFAVIKEKHEPNEDLLRSVIYEEDI